jgi:hypothetical protein
MRSSFAFLAGALCLAGSALAAPFPSSANLFRRQQKVCLTRDEAMQMVEVYRKLIAEYTAELGDKYTSTDFVDVSDSINTFIHQPLGGPTFPNKEVFMDVQDVNPKFPVEIVSVNAVDCDVIALIWRASFGEANLPSRGVTIVTTTKAAGYWQIKRIDVEFNALTWLLNMGGSYNWEDKTYTNSV